MFSADDVRILALLALIIRVIGSIVLTYVLVLQIKLRLRNIQDGLNRYREMLIFVVLVPLLYNFLAIYNNYVRFISGMQSMTINTLTFFLGAIAATVTAFGFLMFYLAPRKKRK